MIDAPQKQPTADEGARVIYGNFNLTAQLPNGRTIAVAGYVYNDDDAQAINDRLDRYQECIERQRARCEIPELEGKREQQIKALEQYREHLAGLEQKRTTGRSLTSQEKLAVQNAQVTIDRANKDLAKGEEQIAELKRKAGMA